jgi:hypothetical protein
VIIVIQCAATKRPNAGHLVTTIGKPVNFVADPESAPVNPACVYARPDDLSDGGVSWRRALLAYNEAPRENPLGLYPAYLLYQNRVYERLIDKYRAGNVYILSAGWGLIRADFLTPHYDITFSPSADYYKRRKRMDQYQHFNMLMNDTDQVIVFFGGKDYLSLFDKLTGAIRSQKIVFFNSSSPPRLNRCTLRRFETATRTNWHYECANAVIDGMIRI